MMICIINIVLSGVYYFYIILLDLFWLGLKRESDDIRNFLIFFIFYIIMFG